MSESNKSASCLESIRSLRPLVETEAESCETQRTITAPVVEAFKKNKLFGFCLPSEVGGSALGLCEMLELWEESASQDPSVGWSFMANTSAASFPAAYLSDEGCEKMFGQQGDPNQAVVAGQFFPNGMAKEVDQGYQLSGKWNFGSGTGHADYVAAGFLILEGEAPKMVNDMLPDMRVAVIPREQINFTDGWHVMGLQGTGSYDYSVEDLFVPESMCFPLAIREPKRGPDWFKLGIMPITAAGHAGFSLGAGRCALEAIRELAEHKQRMADPAPVSKRITFQKAYAEHYGALESTRSWVRDRFAKAEQEVIKNGDIPLELRAELRIATNRANDVALAACDFAHRYAGTSAIRKGNKIERCFRDMHTASQHAFVHEKVYMDAAEVLLGQVTESFSL